MDDNTTKNYTLINNIDSKNEGIFVSINEQIPNFHNKSAKDLELIENELDNVGVDPDDVNRRCAGDNEVNKRCTGDDDVNRRCAGDDVLEMNYFVINLDIFPIVVKEWKDETNQDGQNGITI